MIYVITLTRNAITTAYRNAKRETALLPWTSGARVTSIVLFKTSMLCGPPSVIPVLNLTFPIDSPAHWD